MKWRVMGQLLLCSGTTAAPHSTHTDIHNIAPHSTYMSIYSNIHTDTPPETYTGAHTDTHRVSSIISRPRTHDVPSYFINDPSDEPKNDSSNDFSDDPSNVLSDNLSGDWTDLNSGTSGDDGGIERGGRVRRDECPSQSDPASSIFNFLSNTVLTTTLVINLITSINDNNNNNNNNDNNNNNNDNNFNTNDLMVDVNNMNMNQAMLGRRSIRSTQRSLWFTPVTGNDVCLCSGDITLQKAVKEVVNDNGSEMNDSHDNQSQYVKGTIVPNMDSHQVSKHKTKDTSNSSLNPNEPITVTLNNVSVTQISELESLRNTTTNTQDFGNSWNLLSKHHEPFLATHSSQTNDTEAPGVPQGSNMSSFFSTLLTNNQTMACLSWAICRRLRDKQEASLVEWVSENLALSILEVEVLQFLTEEEQRYLRLAIVRGRYWGDCGDLVTKCRV
ncbi:M-phase inducer phosphatase-like [Homarus americanus]|uniref:M-phase inducer phosphatase-like n=1 Tax=Homarus americanus TaxID=6706 RepID=UPI001C49119A|nr:M-phase inducer phosphatase-like [Homarus americanus]